MKHSNRIFLIFVSSVFFVLGLAAFYFFGKDYFFGLKDTNVPGGAIAQNESVVTCGAGDKACAEKNERVMANNIDGTAAKFVSHQCDGPRACPTPNEEEAQSVLSAIRAFAKEPKLELIRMTGITPIGSIYYCAKDERCWSYNTKDKKVALYEQSEPEEAASNSAESSTDR